MVKQVQFLTVSSLLINKNKVLVTKQIEIDTGHRVPNHKSKCRNFHGHRYVIEVGVDDRVISVEGDSSEGMVIDFGDLKEIMMEVIDKRFDHAFIMYSEDEYADQFEEFRADGQKIEFVDFIPTVENFCKYLFEILDMKLQQMNIRLFHVKIWETPTSSAIYTIHNHFNYGI